MLKQILVLIAFVVQNTAYAQSVPRSVESLATGVPKIADQIGDHSFVPVELERLSNAKVWYVNYDWHREHGVDVPAEGLHSKAFRDQILNAYAWQSHTETDVDHEFTGEKKVGYADYYGGDGAGTNHGSGRAAAFGLVQIKGVKTSLAKSTDPWHSNGAVQTIEAVDETIWSELLDQEFHGGANKIVAVILTGTYGKMKSGQVFPRALIVREMSVRPAHFMISPARQYWSTSGDGKLDLERVAKSLPGLLDSMPYPKGFSSQDPAERLRVGFLTSMELEAQAQAEYVSHRLFFGSYSPSNMELGGRRLDLGDHTAQDGYTPIYRVKHLEDTPFGGTRYFGQLFGEFHSSLMRTLGRDVTKDLMPANQISKTFDAFFKHHRAIEFTRLTGVPTEILETLKSRGVVQNLGEVINEVTRVGAPRDPVFTDAAGWANTSKFDVNRILTDLAVAHASDVTSSLRVISQTVTDPVLAQKFADAYSQFKVEAARQAHADGLSMHALASYFEVAAKGRNLNRPDLVRGDKRFRQLWDTTDLAISRGEGDPTLIQNYIEKHVDDNVSEIKTSEPYTFIVSESRDSAKGLSVQRVFDAKANSFATITKISLNEGHAVIDGKTYSVREFENSNVEFRAADGSVHTIRPVVRGNTVSVKMSEGATLHSARLVPRVEVNQPAPVVRPGFMDSLKDQVRTLVRPLRVVRSCEGLFAS